MGLFNTMAEFVRTKIQNFLHITPAPVMSVVLNEVHTKEIANIKYRTWYKGIPEQLSQLYQQLDYINQLAFADVRVLFLLGRF